MKAILREIQDSEDAPSIEVKVQQQLQGINTLIGRSSGSERRALEKAREELLCLVHFMAGSQRSDLRT